MSKFNCTQSGTPEKLELKLSGHLDEDASLPQGIKAREITVDFGELKSINSLGIQAWISWHKKNIPSETHVTIANCPVSVVNQINLVANFLPTNCTIKSFQIPFFCNACGATKNILAHNGVEFTQEHGKGKANLMLPELKCQCGEMMEIEVLEATYFKFLTTY